jgi:hypothetical protein
MIENLTREQEASIYAVWLSLIDLNAEDRHKSAFATG